MSTWNHRLLSVDEESATGVCGKCGPVDLYYRKAKDRWQCRVARQEQKGSGNPEASRAAWLMRAYGVTVEEYDAKLEEQDGRCAICRKRPRRKKLHVDHDHETGAVRGLLCFRCNAGLGNFLDNPRSLKRAYQYLKQYA